MTKLSRRSLLSATAGLCVLPYSGIGATPRNSGKPNIVFIMADDLGYADLGCYGSRHIETPNIDRLAKEGLQLFHGYANSPVCSATRTALMTGNYQYRLPCGLAEPIFGQGLGLPSDVPTLPKQLQGSDYRTVLVGKWHLGELPDYSPLNCGYDRFFGIAVGGVDYFRHEADYDGYIDGALIEGETTIERTGYLTDLLGDRAVQEIEDAAGAQTPLFLSLHFTAPHWPWEGPEDEAIAQAIKNSLHTDGGSLATYGKMVESMDANVGKVLTALDRLGMAENTIVIFTSDNGGERFSDVWPFTGAKTELLEGGIRVPIVMRWPQRIIAGSTSDQMLISMDFVPTLAAAGNSDLAGLELDGENLLGILTGEEPERERQLFWRYDAADQAAVRKGDWKYLKLAGRDYLFNLAEDQHERADRKAHEPEIFAQLKRDWDEWNGTMLPYPVDNPSHTITEMLPDRYTVD